MFKSIFTVFCVMFLTACASEAGTPVFTISTENPADTVTASVIANNVTFDLTSPSGIGKAQFKRAGGSIPKRIDFRIHTKGLENFTLLDASRQYQVNVPSGGGVVQSFMGLRDGELGEHPLLSDEPFYMKTEIFASNKTIPLTDGYFQVTAPQSLIDAGARDFSISWIDFYR